MKKLAGVTNEEITIANSMLQVRKNSLVSMVENFGDDIDVGLEAKVSGPSSVALAKTGNTYTGNTSRPIVTSFEGSFLEKDFSGKLNTRVAATV